MNSATDPVLELLDSTDIAITSGAIIYELDTVRDICSERTIRRALNDLRDREYIEAANNGNLLEITERGKEYLQGKRDARDDT